MLAAAPGSSATVEVALAMIAGWPRKTRAGKVTMVPPPARAFINPPMAAAASMITTWLGVITGVHGSSGVVLQSRQSSFPAAMRAGAGGVRSPKVVARHRQHLLERPEPLAAHRDAAVALLQHSFHD